MPAITHQKNEEAQEIIKLMSDIYDRATMDDRRELFIDLIRGYSNDMTLRQLQNWHENIMDSLDSSRRRG